MRRLKYQEIKDIITNHYGIKTLDDYINFRSNLTEPFTLEEIALLSPDNVNCIDFWKVCDDLFGYDPVCNSIEPDPITKICHFKNDSMSKANRVNLWIAKSMGITVMLDEYASALMNTLEIGAGYGCLKNYIEANTRHSYIGFDVVPRIPGIQSLDEAGEFYDNMSSLHGKTNYVLCSNTFQHLSDKQRLYYFDQVVKLLVPQGLFIFNFLKDNLNCKKYRGVDGRRYTMHYGQLTPLPTMPWIEKELNDRRLQLHIVTQRKDDVVNIVAQYLP